MRGYVARSLVAVTSGLLFAGLIITTGEVVGRLFFRPAAGLTRSESTEADIHRAKRRMQGAWNLLKQGRYEDAFFQAEVVAAEFPVRALVVTLLFWLIGAVLGAAVTARVVLQASMRYAFIVGMVLVAAGLAAILIDPRPLWFWPPGVALLLPAAFLGARLTLRLGSPPRPIEKVTPSSSNP